MIMGPNLLLDDINFQVIININNRNIIHLIIIY